MFYNTDIKLIYSNIIYYVSQKMYNKYYLLL